MPRFRSADAPELRPLLEDLVHVLAFAHIDPDRVHLRRSWGSTAKAYARIWELPSVWREALGIPAQYVIEVLAEHFDCLSPEEQVKIVIHELLHIPGTFSGALRNHRGSGERIDGHAVNRYYRRYRRLKEEEAARAERGQLALPLDGPVSDGSEGGGAESSYRSDAR